MKTSLSEKVLPCCCRRLVIEEAQRVWVLVCWTIVLRCKPTVVDAPCITSASDPGAGHRRLPHGRKRGVRATISLLCVVHYILNWFDGRLVLLWWSACCASSAIAELWFSRPLLLLFSLKHCATVNLCMSNLITRSFSVLGGGASFLWLRCVVWVRKTLSVFAMLVGVCL